MDALASIVKFLALNGLTTAAALGFVSRFGLGSRAERCLATIVLFVGIALASGMALGLSGHLRIWPLLGLQTAIAVGALSAARWSVIRETLDPRPVRRIIASAALATAVMLVGLAYLYVAFLGLVSEPSAGDELMYHLPLAASFAQEGRIVVPRLGRYWHTDWWAYHPANAYVLYQWWLLPIGSGRLLDLVQMPLALGTGLATYVLARRFGAHRRGALWGALLFCAVPVVINQCKTGLVDVTLSFLFAAGLAFALTPRLGGFPLLLSAIAWGALPGAKLSGMVYLAAGAACILGQLASEVGGRELLRRACAIGALLTTAALLLSGYWFARNYWLKGSAIFPLSVLDAQDIVWTNIIFYGPILPLLDFSGYQPKFSYNYETGAGLQFVGLALPAAAALAVTAIRRRRWGVAASAAVGLGMYFFWVVMHSRELHTLSRFALPAMPIGFAAAGWLISTASRPRLLISLALLGVAFSVINAVPHVGTFIIPGSLNRGLAQLVRGESRFGRFDRMGDLALQDYRRGWHYLDGLAGARNIAASHLVFSYPMLGPDLRHRVHFPVALTRESWLADLEKARIDHVAVGQTLDPMHRVRNADGDLQLSMEMRVIGDESLAAVHRLPPLRIRGLRVRYHVDAPTNARVLIGLNGFADMVELPLDSAGAPREHTVEWQGVLTDLGLVLAFVPRTRLRDDIRLRVSELSLLADGGATVPVTLAAEHWPRALWPLELYWMEGAPQRFRLAFRDRHFWADSSQSEMRIYEVVR